jgi:serine/threonine protein kinase
VNSTDYTIISTLTGVSTRTTKTSVQLVASRIFPRERHITSTHPCSRSLLSSCLQPTDLVLFLRSKELLDHCYADLFKADIFSLGISIYELASSAPLAASPGVPEYDALRQGCIPPLHGLSAEFQSILSSMMNPEASLRPSAADIVRHPMLFPLLRPETAACLRVSPPRHGAARTAGADSSPADQSTMLKMHLRALDAETKVAKLQAMLQEAQTQAQMYKDCVEHAISSGGAGSHGAAGSHHNHSRNHGTPAVVQGAPAAAGLSESKKKVAIPGGLDCSA